MTKFYGAALAVLLLLAGPAPSSAQTGVDASAPSAEAVATSGQSNGRNRVSRNARRATSPAGNAAPAPDYRPGAGRLDHQTGGPNPSIPSR